MSQDVDFYVLQDYLLDLLLTSSLTHGIVKSQRKVCLRDQGAYAMACRIFGNYDGYSIY